MLERRIALNTIDKQNRYVAQSVSMARWLAGVEMGLAVGVALSSAELTMIFAAWMLPVAATDYGVGQSLLLGGLMAVGSLSATVLASALDAWGNDQYVRGSERGVLCGWCVRVSCCCVLRITGVITCLRFIRLPKPPRGSIHPSSQSSKTVTATMTTTTTSNNSNVSTSSNSIFSSNSNISSNNSYQAIPTSNIPDTTNSNTNTFTPNAITDTNTDTNTNTTSTSTNTNTSTNTSTNTTTTTNSKENTTQITIVGASMDISNVEYGATTTTNSTEATNTMPVSKQINEEGSHRILLALLAAASLLILPGGALSHGVEGLENILYVAAALGPAIGWVIDRAGRPCVFLALGTASQLCVLLTSIITRSLHSYTHAVSDAVGIVLGVTWAVTVCGAWSSLALLVPGGWGGIAFACVTVVNTAAISVAPLFYIYTHDPMKVLYHSLLSPLSLLSPPLFPLSLSLLTNPSRSGFQQQLVRF
jgi:hypothetical protein